MSSGIEHEIKAKQIFPEEIRQSAPTGEDTSKAFLTELHNLESRDRQLMFMIQARAESNPNLTNAKEKLPEIQLVAAKVGEGLRLFPWSKEQDPNAVKQHMSHGQLKDGMVKMGEGPHHVAKRLLGDGADKEDVKLLTEALKEQYKQERPVDQNLESVRIGHNLIREDNIQDILDRIPDDAARVRIAERLKLGWSEIAPPPTVPFDKRGREGETRPESIDDPALFLKELAQSAIEVKAAELRAKGLCAQGARLAFNQLPGWHIDGGTVDRSINKDPNGWRSGVQLAKDLAESGLFDVVPLKTLGYKNLKEGYVLGRYHYPDYVKDRPSWEGEDMGDIDIMTKKHRPPDDDKKMYHDSFVLIPKGFKR